ncbi:MAG TPA: fluoride efflux transporter CrcB [Alphaproteobacteria bacterium]|nr:fluoride efflux transporter CrcB [Alphaproteobacteria bacterium]HNS44915.1 fluoride efflux transporter CrcB [Alphaproteobacteria bacterium]
MILHFLIVGFGGALGAMARHGVNMASLKWLGTDFPYGTLTVNIIGSIFIGLLTGCFAHFASWSQEIRLFLVVGILGGFTTFSSFSLDTVLLFEKGAYYHALFYVLSSFILSVSGTVAGLWIIRQFVA